MTELHPYEGPRGFHGYTELTCSYGSKVSLQQSSAAFKHRAWLRIHQDAASMGEGDGTAHLTPENAAELIVALQEFIDADRAEEDLAATKRVIDERAAKLDWRKADDTTPWFAEHIQKSITDVHERMNRNIEEQLMAMLLDGGPGVAYGTFVEEPYTIVAMSVRHPAVPFGEMQDHTRHLTSRRAWDDFVTNG